MKQMHGYDWKACYEVWIAQSLLIINLVVP